MAPDWFLQIIGKLSRDYESYNKVLKKIIKDCENPVRSEIIILVPEEKRLSGEILIQEKVLARWLEDAAFLKAGSEDALAHLESLRNESQKLRQEGRRSLKRGVSLLEKESRQIKPLPAQKSSNKEAAPRLIDITL